ncbi:MAG: hypothetical protein WDZ28_00565 [Simkaniaceae bacterium]
MKRIKFLFVGMLLIFSSSFAQKLPSSQELIDHAKYVLPCTGVLRSTEKWIYVDVDDAYVHDLFSFIEEEGFEKPPYFSSEGAVGAHITVAYPDEVKKYRVFKIEESGEKIDFVLKRCEIVHPPTWEEIDELYLITVEAPQLDQIREKYGLPEKIHDFHITVAVKPEIARAG